MTQHPVPLLDRLRPMLPARSQEPFDSPNWLFELKWDGVRALAFINKGKLVLRGQNGRDLTDAYPELQGLPSQLKGSSAVLDGDIVAMGSAGHPDIELLRPRLNQLLRAPAQGARGSLVYELSDILSLDGQLLTDLPLWERKNILHSHVEPSKTAQLVEFVEGDGIAFYDAVCEHGLEGMIAKEKRGAYHPGRRSRAWLEIPAQEVGYYVIGGYTFGGGQKKEAFQTLLLGAYDERGALRYVGRATAGLASPEAWRTVRLLEELHSATCPFATSPTVNRFSFWCEPKLVCQVRLGEQAKSGELRFAVFVSLRPDMAPQDCQLETDTAPEDGA